MIDAQAFARFILLDATDENLLNADQRETAQLWELWGQLEDIQVESNTAIVQMRDNQVEIIAAAWNGKLLTRAKESILDSADHNWRTATPDLPRNYLCRGELGAQQLRLHPRPAEAGRLQIIEQAMPDTLPRVLDILKSLMIINRLTISDSRRNRLPESKFMEALIRLIIGSLHERAPSSPRW